jgi:hypothetical protein
MHEMRTTLDLPDDLLRVARAIARDEDRTLSQTVPANRDEELLWDLSDQLGPEDGMIGVYDIDDGQTLAFTMASLDALSELIREQVDRTA